MIIEIKNKDGSSTTRVVPQKEVTSDELKKIVETPKINFDLLSQPFTLNCLPVKLYYQTEN